MIPYKSPLPTALPQTLEKRREVIQAIRNLAAREDEPLRERQADIASLRRELKEIAQALRQLRNASDPRLTSYVAKYGTEQPLAHRRSRWPAHTLCAEAAILKASPDDPEHPGWPAGTPDGKGGEFRPKNGETGAVGDIAAETARRRIDLTLEEECEAQYEKDLVECRLVGSPACYAQAMVRYASCLHGLPIPPLSY